MSEIEVKPADGFGDVYSLSNGHRPVVPAHAGVVPYLEIWHNRRRRHSALGWLSPLESENQSKIVAVQIPV